MDLLVTKLTPAVQSTSASAEVPKINVPVNNNANTAYSILNNSQKPNVKEEVGRRDKVDLKGKFKETDHPKKLSVTVEIVGGGSMELEIPQLIVLQTHRDASGGTFLVYNSDFNMYIDEVHGIGMTPEQMVHQFLEKFSGLPKNYLKGFPMTSVSTSSSTTPITSPREKVSSKPAAVIPPEVEHLASHNLANDLAKTLPKKSVVLSNSNNKAQTSTTKSSTTETSTSENAGFKIKQPGKFKEKDGEDPVEWLQTVSVYGAGSGMSKPKWVNFAITCFQNKAMVWWNGKRTELRQAEDVFPSLYIS